MNPIYYISKVGSETLDYAKLILFILINFVLFPKNISEIYLHMI